MNYRKLMPWIYLGCIGFVLLLIYVLKSHLLMLSIILIVLTVLGIIAVVTAVFFDRTKDIYQLSGALVAWVALLLVFLLWSPIAFTAFTSTKVFWGLHAFLLINLVLLGRTGVTVFIVRTIVTFGIIGSVITLITLFSKDGTETIAQLGEKGRLAVISGQITEIRSIDKRKQIEPVLERIKEIKKEAKKGPLSEERHTELKQIESDLKEKEEDLKNEIGQNTLSQNALPPTAVTFKLPADGTVISLSVAGEENWFKKGERALLIQSDPPGLYRIVNETGDHLDIHKKSYTTGHVLFDAPIKLQSRCNRDLTITVRHL